MSTDKANAQPLLTAEQALQRVLELIRTSKTVAEFTPERLEKVMKVPVKTSEMGYGFGERLTPQWGAGFQVISWEGKPRFDYGFSPDPDLPSSALPPPMTDICQLNFDQFKAALQAMGFSNQAVYDSPPHALPGQERLPHGRWMFDNFDRPGMRVQVYPEWEHAEAQESNMGRMCVKHVYIY